MMSKLIRSTHYHPIALRIGSDAYRDGESHPNHGIKCYHANTNTNKLRQLHNDIFHAELT